MTKLSTIFVTC